jgi:hypothetical protein
MVGQQVCDIGFVFDNQYFLAHESRAEQEIYNLGKMRRKHERLICHGPPDFCNILTREAVANSGCYEDLAASG